jgi:hypothetical protein
LYCNQVIFSKPVCTERETTRKLWYANSLA